jgi:hypothetical protein
LLPIAASQSTFILGAADETVLKTVHRKKKSIKSPCLKSFENILLTNLAVLVFLLASSVDADIGALILMYNL